MTNPSLRHVSAEVSSVLRVVSVGITHASRCGVRRYQSCLSMKLMSPLSMVRYMVVAADGSYDDWTTGTGVGPVDSPPVDSYPRAWSRNSRA